MRCALVTEFRRVLFRSLLEMLRRQGKSLESVPLLGEIVGLRGTANLSSGGTAIDRTDENHPENALVAEQAAMTIGLDISGIDFLSPDISRMSDERRVVKECVSTCRSRW